MFSINDVLSIIQWWIALFALGIIFFPITNKIFSGFNDRGYLFSKVIGIGATSYLILLFGMLHILPFNLISIVLIIWLLAMANFFIFKKSLTLKKLPIKIIIVEEIIFLLGIVVWSFIRAHEPSLNGLEKFMDYGFLNSILKTTYQPATDMWFPPLPINYYYFGHLSTAVLTKISFLPSNISYNLMIATLFAFCFSLSFSLGINVINKENITKKTFFGGLLIGVLVSLAGNLHTIYTFFQPYNVDKPVPFWNLNFLPATFPNSYWYPNATRFIPFTIHEFPIYSFVVSDLHGHVVDIMYVFLVVALIYIFFLNKGISKLFLALISFVLALMYMTNVWDGVIYMLLIFLVLAAKNINLIHFKKIKMGDIKIFLIETINPALTVLLLFVIFSLPFNLFFKPFASGIGILCAPTFLTNIGKIGPFLFEADHCQKSTWWELLTLYGFFYFFVISFFAFIFHKRIKLKVKPSDIFVMLLILLSTILIIVPEFIYLKDIYPQHYRANTMFKLVYQAFMLLGVSSGYIIFRIIPEIKDQAKKIFNFQFVYLVVTVILLSLVIIYPYFAVTAYYGNLKNYSGLDGLIYLKTKAPEDYDAINWINQNISGRPVMVEAQGDSYTDYERVSANTGLPTILGWTVHEWLWRGSYDIPAPRIEEVKNVYESTDLTLTKNLLKKYDAQYVYVGTLEREKYPNIDEQKFDKLGKVIWEENRTRIYKIN